MATRIDHLTPEVQQALSTDMTIDITTTGRRSGERRRIEIWFLNVDGDFYITGTPRTRDWNANLLAHSSFTFHLKESTQADLAAAATGVTDPAERRRVFQHPAASWYLRQGVSLDDLVEQAPMVRITFD